MLAKAAASDADEMVVDLEDAVPVGEKEVARDGLAAALSTSPGQVAIAVAVRINAPRSRWCHRDLEAVAAIDGVRSVVVPKVEGAGDVAFCDRLLDGVEASVERSRPLGLQLLIESAGGLARAAEIAASSPRVEALILGYADLAASLGRPQRGEVDSWRYAQEQVLVAARASSLAAIDGPFFGLGDEAGLRAACEHAAGLGFDGKWAIHPAQLESINAAFTPAPEQVERASAVLAALAEAERRGSGAASLDGEMVDEAMAAAARRVLARAAAEAR